MKILYVNHTSVVSGAEHSLSTLLRALPSEVSPAVACPDGAFAENVRGLGIPVYQTPEATGSLRLHPLHTTRAVAELAAAAVAVRGIIRRTRPDVVHANSIRAGVILSLATGRNGPPTIVHVRDCLPPGPVSFATRRLIVGAGATLISNSRYTEECYL